MELHVYIHCVPDTSVPAWAKALQDSINSVIQKETIMSQEMDNLVASVTASTTAQDSAITLLQGLSAQLTAAIASGNPAAIQALSDSLTAETQKLAAAVVANTPAQSGGAPGGGPAPAAAASRGR